MIRCYFFKINCAIKYFLLSDAEDNGNNDYMWVTLRDVSIISFLVIRKSSQSSLSLNTHQFILNISAIQPAPTSYSSNQFYVVSSHRNNSIEQHTPEKSNWESWTNKDHAVFRTKKSYKLPIIVINFLFLVQNIPINSCTFLHSFFTFK